MPIFSTVKAKPRACLPPSDGVELWIWIRLFAEILKNRNDDDYDNNNNNNNNNNNKTIIMMMMMIKSSSRHSYTCMYKL